MMWHETVHFSPQLQHANTDRGLVMQTDWSSQVKHGKWWGSLGLEETWRWGKWTSVFPMGQAGGLAADSSAAALFPEGVHSDAAAPGSLWGLHFTQEETKARVRQGSALPKVSAPTAPGIKPCSDPETWALPLRLTPPPHAGQPLPRRPLCGWLRRTCWERIGGPSFWQEPGW